MPYVVYSKVYGALLRAVAPRAQSIAKESMVDANNIIYQQ